MQQSGRQDGERRNTRALMKELFGEEGDLTGILGSLTMEQRLAYAIKRIGEDVCDIKEQGCNRRPDDLARLDSIERRVDSALLWARAVPVILVGAGTVLGVVWLLIQVWHAGGSAMSK